MLADKERLTLKIFHDYYVRNLSQNEIASRHFISRQKVQRYLEQGRADNLVEVRIKFPARMHGNLESELEDRYNLLEACVVEVPEGSDLALIRRNVAEMAADYFLRVLAKDMVVSVCWSSFVAEMNEIAGRNAESLREKPGGIDIVQSLGATADNDPELNIYESSRRLAAALGARLHLILAPGITASAEAYRTLIGDPQIAGVLALARKAQAAFFGIGAVEGGSNLMQSIKRVMPEMPGKLKKLGVVGDINGRFFNAQGEGVKSDLDERLIGLSLAEVKALPLSVGVTGGPEKFAALQAVARGGIVKALVIDLENARRLME